MIMGPMTHAPWLGSCVFDGARAFEGVAPDLDLHCERSCARQNSFGLKAVKTAAEIEDSIREGIAKFPKGRRTLSAPDVLGGGRLRRRRSGNDPLFASRSMTRRCRRPRASPSPARPSGGRPTNLRRPMPRPPATIPIRPAPCARRGARLRQCGDARRGSAHVSELATANIFYAKDGEVHTPVPNGTFLSRHHAPARHRASAQRRHQGA